MEVGRVERRWTTSLLRLHEASSEAITAPQKQQAPRAPDNLPSARRACRTIFCQHRKCLPIDYIKPAK